MKMYNKPAIEICSFDIKDIITISSQEEKVTNLSGTASGLAIDNLETQVGELNATNVTVFRW